mmetsp:Transcript_13007/g.17429  ORF Transcript_13007/g.17429 Transcript_13007/m.17429 type:complete len:136 (+) Transcript_13007:541-948(+)
MLEEKSLKTAAPNLSLVGRLGLAIDLSLEKLPLHLMSPKAKWASLLDLLVLLYWVAFSEEGWSFICVDVNNGMNSRSNEYGTGGEMIFAVVHFEMGLDFTQSHMMGLVKNKNICWNILAVHCNVMGQIIEIKITS